MPTTSNEKYSSQIHKNRNAIYSTMFCNKSDFIILYILSCFIGKKRNILPSPILKAEMLNDWGTATLRQINTILKSQINVFRL